MKNWWKARRCHGCKFLEVGRKVDHNHCVIGGLYQEQRVAGHVSTSCYHKKSNKHMEPTSESLGKRQDGSCAPLTSKMQPILLSPFRSHTKEEGEAYSNFIDDYFEGG